MRPLTKPDAQDLVDVKLELIANGYATGGQVFSTSGILDPYAGTTPNFIGLISSYHDTQGVNALAYRERGTQVWTPAASSFLPHSSWPQSIFGYCSGHMGSLLAADRAMFWNTGAQPSHVHAIGWRVKSGYSVKQITSSGVMNPGATSRTLTFGVACGAASIVLLIVLNHPTGLACTGTTQRLQTPAGGGYPLRVYQDLAPSGKTAFTFTWTGTTTVGIVGVEVGP